MNNPRKLLQCYSWGNKNYSAMYARLTCGWTIERVYQNSKRDKNGKPYISAKGVKPNQIVINGALHKCSNTLRHELYNSLWFIYFKENPHLFSEAMSYEGFYERDPQKYYTPCIKTFETNLFNERGCDQAITIAWLIFMRKRPPEEIFSKEVIDAMIAYWQRNHPHDLYAINTSHES